MNCCNDTGQCKGGPDCPVRSAPPKPPPPADEPPFTFDEVGIWMRSAALAAIAVGLGILIGLFLRRYL